MTFKSDPYTSVILQCVYLFCFWRGHIQQHSVSTTGKHPLPSQKYFGYILNKCQRPFLPQPTAHVGVPMSWRQWKGGKQWQCQRQPRSIKGPQKNKGEVINWEIPTFLAPTRLIIFLPLSEAGIGEKLNY